MSFSTNLNNYAVKGKEALKNLLAFLKDSYSCKLKSNKNLYCIQASHRGKSGKQLVVCKVNDSARGVFVMSAVELVLNRKDLLAGFSTEDIVNIVGLAASEKEPLVIETRDVSYKYLSVFSILFIFFLVAAAITSPKLAAAGGFIFPAGLLWYQPSYLISDTITEVYGYKKMRKLIWIAALCYILLALILQVSIALPPAEHWHYQLPYSNTLNSISRISLSGVMSFTVSEFLNSYILAKLKLIYKGRFLILRLFFSTLVDTFSDCFLFTLISYSTSLHQAYFLKLFFIDYSIRVLYDICLFPVTYAVINHVKKKENCNIFDMNTNFTPFSLDTEYQKKKIMAGVD